MSARVVLTYKDYEALPPDGRRYELHEGELSVTPAPSPQHQLDATRLALSRRGVEGPPTLVVEILSPSTKTKDRGVKSRYAELVSCNRDSLPISSSNRRRWLGGATTEYREYCEEVQRSQRRRGPARS